MWSTCRGIKGIDFKLRVSPRVPPVNIASYLLVDCLRNHTAAHAAANADMAKHLPDLSCVRVC